VKLNKIGMLLAIVYVVVALVIALQDFNCGGGLDISICGVGTLFITFPSYLTVGWLLSKMGLSINFRHKNPSATDLAQLAAHIAICAAIVYFVWSGLKRVGSGLFRRPK
jgi:hypothetical protein